MKKHNKGFIQIPLLVFVVVAIGVVIYLSNKTNPNPIPVSNNIDQVTATPSPINDQGDNNLPSVQLTPTPSPVFFPTSTPTPISTSVPTVTQESQLIQLPNTGNSAFDLLDGNAYLVAADGEYLGLISSNRFDSDSITNEYGTYGSKYSTTSILNQYGEYGSKYSTKSAFNKYTQNPPQIIYQGSFYAYLTVNKYLVPSIHTEALVGYLKSK